MKRVLVGILLALVIFGGAMLGRLLTLTYGKVESLSSSDTVRLELKRSFIEAYKNRVTVAVTFTVDEAMRAPLPNMFDGDLHFAGRSAEVSLPAVAEISNAHEQDSAVALIHRAESGHQPVHLMGPWRIWPEHPVKARQTQGGLREPPKSANPDHAFEIHPVIGLEGLDLSGSLHPVDGYQPPSAGRALGQWNKITCTLRVTADTVVLVTSTGLENDARFLMQLAGDQIVVDDGRFVTARLMDLNGKVLAEGIRLVFAKGTPPELEVRSLPAGTRRTVWGLARVSFAELARRIASARPGQTLSGKLPYEIVVLGLYPDE